MKIRVKRAYDTVEKSDGFRVLVDRLWPRGVSKEKARIDLWAKEIAPSSELRKWFHEDTEGRLKDFSKKYSKELTQSKALKELRKELSEKKVITFVTAVKGIDHSHIPTLIKRLSK
jgi:uncharacterized protein YeaO (DUF488 family)